MIEKSERERTKREEPWEKNRARGKDREQIGETLREKKI